MRVTMHPDQFILINSLDEDIYERSAGELVYHAEVLDLMGLDASHKIQIHVGGVYGDKEASMARFASRYRKLPSRVKRRLVLENDDRSYGLVDCLAVHADTGVPLVFDTLHHSANNRGEEVREALAKARSTWQKKDGLPMVDYSSQKKGGKPGAHAYALDPDDFRSFLEQARGLDFDVMLEVKNKERSALEALSIADEISLS
jgi:UV DNA damage endonuclease